MTALSTAQCLLFPITWQEPFGLVLVEAMACGTPVVALRAGSVPEVVVNGETGIICDDVTELASGIEAATHLDPARCRAHTREHFAAATMVERYEAVYRTLIRSAKHA
jgi:glycosyltransferase involved in cell wall biosynthesis